MNSVRLLTRMYRIGGSTLLAVRSDLRAALDTLGMRYLETTEFPGAAPLLEIFLLDGGNAGRAGVEIPASAHPIYTGESVAIHSANEHHYGSWYGKAASVADFRNGRAIICIPDLRHYHPDFISRFIFRPVLDRLLFDRGWLPLHAAAAGVDGRGCLLVGTTGTGKSTLLLGLLEKGLGFLADDRALLRVGNGRFTIHSFPERIRLVSTITGRKNSRSVPGPEISQAEAKMLLFLDPERAGESRVERIGAAEAAARLAHSVSPYLEPRERRELLPVIGELCRATVCGVVRGWGDPGERASLVGNFLRKGLER